MGVAAGPQFGAQNKGYEIYGFETENTDCVFIVNTEAVTPGATSFTIRTTGTCTYVVDWGDDSSETVTTTTATHNYSTAGTYNVGIRVVSGTFRPYYNNNADGDVITKFRGRSDFEFTGSLDGAFYGCGNLDEITADFSNVTSITNAFRDTPLVDFQNTGAGATVLNQNLFGFNDLSSVTSNTSAFTNCSSLKNIVGLDFSSTTSLSGVFDGTTNPVRFGTENLPIKLGTTAGDLSLSSLFSQKTNLREVHLDYGERISSLQSAFYQSGITTFSVGDNNLSNCTSMQNAFIYSSLTEFPGVNLVGCTSLYQAFQQGSLVKFGTQANPVGLGSTADNPSTCSLVQAFYSTSSFKEFHVDSGDRISSLNNAFYQSGITTFSVGDNDLSNCTSLRSAFFATPLTEFSGFNLVGCTDFHKAFQSNTALVNFGTQANPIGLGTIGDNASTCTWPDTFYGVSTLKEVHIDSGTRVGDFSASFVNTGITTFRINDTNLSSVTTMSSAFLNSALDTASIENILVSCDNGGKSSITLTLSGGSNAAKTTWTSAANTAYTNLIGKSWTITYNA